MQLHNREQKVNTKQLFKIKYLKPYFRNIVNTLNYGSATNRNKHTYQLLFEADVRAAKPILPLFA